MSDKLASQIVPVPAFTKIEIKSDEIGFLSDELSSQIVPSLLTTNKIETKSDEKKKRAKADDLLLAEWKELVTSNGEKYYWNAEQNCTTWVRPTDANTHLESLHDLGPIDQNRRKRTPGAPPKVAKAPKAQPTVRSKPRWQTLNGRFPEGLRFKEPSGPNKTDDEAIAMTDDRLAVESNNDGEAEKAMYRLTEFSVFTEDGWLVSLDSGLMEKDVELFACGVIKPIFDEDPTAGTFPLCVKLGPIISWHVEGYAEGGDKAIVSIETPYADYKLLGNPSEQYRVFIQLIMEKAALTKGTMEFLEKQASDELTVGEGATYEKLLGHLVTIPPPTADSDAFTEDSVLSNMTYLLNQIWEYDQWAGEQDVKLFDLPAVKYLEQLEGRGVSRARAERRGVRAERRGAKDTFQKRHAGRSATVTPVVAGVFSEYFSRELEKVKRVEDNSWMPFLKSRQGALVTCRSSDKAAFGVFIFDTVPSIKIVIKAEDDLETACDVENQGFAALGAAFPDGATWRILSLAQFERAAGSKAKKARESIRFVDDNQTLDQTAQTAGWFREEVSEECDDDEDEDEDAKPSATTADPNQGATVAERDLEDEDDEVAGPRVAKKNFPRRSYFADKVLPILNPNSKKTTDLWSGVQFHGKSASESKDREYYSECILTSAIKGAQPTTLRIGDFVVIDWASQNAEDLVGIHDDDDVWVVRVNFMWKQKKSGEARFNGLRFVHGAATILGKVAGPVELFVVDQCVAVDFSTAVLAKIPIVMHEPIPENWNLRGAYAEEKRDEERERLLESGNCEKVEIQRGVNAFLWRFQYEPTKTRFFYPAFADMRTLAATAIDLALDRDAGRIDDATFDERLKLFFLHKQEFVGPKALGKIRDDGTFGSAVLANGTVIVPGDAVLVPHAEMDLEGEDLASKAIKERDTSIESERAKRQKEAGLYTELFRKTEGRKPKGSHDDVRPFRIARVVSIMEDDDDEIAVLLEKFYRPEDTHLGEEQGFLRPEKEIFLSKESETLTLQLITEKVSVVFLPKASNEEFVQASANTNATTFLCRRSYVLVDKTRGKFESLTDSFIESLPETATKVPGSDVPTNVRPLNLLDIFAGCGGLSVGLEKAGACKSRWAIEFEPPAAKAFKDNHQDATVFCDDCNTILALALEGAETTESGLVIPKRGEVEALAGGPPCQGFSGMNRFNSRQYSRFKNSLVATYLSYCDFYRPRLFLLENVKNFAMFHEGIVVQMCVRSLLEMGYQATFGCLQAGSYGVPQTRRRALVVGSAPGDVLPRYPEPTHTFTRVGMQINVNVNGYVICAIDRVNGPAPLRRITVRDALGDLPPIQLGESREIIPYESEPQTDFQRRLRVGQSANVVTNHIVKKFSPLVLARFERIPAWAGADWRDLPNEEITLTNGMKTQKLEYLGRSLEMLKDRTGHGGVGHTPQDNTLIPWCLPHTANRHNQWSGLYGRLDWGGHFGTTVTNPEPMGKQGVVVHPEQHRVVSVRECARSQGFPDSYCFTGNIIDRHRQIGNAVPPPLAQAIGREWRKALSQAQPKFVWQQPKVEVAAEDVVMYE